MNIWVYAENEGKDFKKIVFQTIGGLKSIFGEDVKVDALVLSQDELNFQPIFEAGAEVIHLKNELLGSYSPNLYSKAIELAYNEQKPDAIFFGSTFQGRDISPGLSARLNVGMASDCIDIEYNDGDITLIRPMYAGKIHARVRPPKNAPIIATFRQNTLSPSSEILPSDENVEEMSVELSEDDRLTEIVEIKKRDEDVPDVSEASIIVSGGRGMKNPENFEMLFELAKLLNAGVGASRVAVDEGWLPQPHQVGQTGKTVSPNLYLACGISGAIQHQAGMKSSRCIVAINTDPEAEIFKIADFGIVGDLFEIVPEITKQIKEE